MDTSRPRRENDEEKIKTVVEIKGSVDRRRLVFTKSVLGREFLGKVVLTYPFIYLHNLSYLLVNLHRKNFLTIHLKVFLITAQLY